MDPYQAASHGTCLSGSSSSVGSIPSTLQSKSMRSVSFKGKFMEELDRCYQGLEEHENLTKQINVIKPSEKKDVKVLKLVKESLAGLSDCVKKDAVDENNYNAVRTMRLEMDQTVFEAKQQLGKLSRKMKKAEEKLRKQEKNK